MARVGRDEVEAAYFSLLRAREELAELRRYQDFLENEQRRLHRFVADGDALDAHVDPKLRRQGIGHTDRALADAIKRRHEVIEAQLQRLPDRIEAAEEFVEESEREHARLKAD